MLEKENRNIKRRMKSGHRYLFNAMENDPEVSGLGNSYTTEFRQYDPRLGRWKSVDPLSYIQPGWSPYKAMYDNPIYWVDPRGGTEEERKKAVRKAREYAAKSPGNRSRYGSNGMAKPGKPIDCSGLVRACIVSAGLEDPNPIYKKSRGVLNVMEASTKIDNINDMEVGNAVTMYTSSPTAHIGIVTEITRENGKIVSYKVIHSGSSTGPTEVTINAIDKTKGHWSDKITGIYKWDTEEEEREKNENIFWKAVIKYSKAKSKGSASDGAVAAVARTGSLSNAARLKNQIASHARTTSLNNSNVFSQRAESANAQRIEAEPLEKMPTRGAGELETSVTPEIATPNTTENE